MAEDESPIDSVAQLLKECSLEALEDTLKDAQLDGWSSTYESGGGRTALLTELKTADVASLTQRQKLATHIGKAIKQGRFKSAAADAAGASPAPPPAAPGAAPPAKAPTDVASAIAALPPIGESTYLPQEGRIRSVGPLLKPMAKVRLIVLHGVGDMAASLDPVRTAGPDWCEVRTPDYPGNGYRKAEGGGYPCGERTDRLDVPTICRARARLIKQLTDDILHLTTMPYALYGFSLGASLACGVVRELASRGAPPPLVLCCVGLPAIHAMWLPRELMTQMQTLPAPETLAFMGGQFGFGAMDKIHPSQTEATAAKFRGGMLMVALHAAQAVDAPLPSAYDSIGPRHVRRTDGVVAYDASFPMTYTPAADAPAITTCPTLVILGGDDKLWPAEPLLGRWEEVAKAGFTKMTVPGYGHEKLMNAPETLRAIFDKVAECVLERANGKAAAAVVDNA